MISVLTEPGNFPFAVALGLMLAITLLELIAVLCGFGLSSFTESLLPEGGLDAHPDAHLGGGLSEVVGWLCVGRVPLLMLLILLLTGFGLSGLMIQSLARGLFGAPLPGWLAVVPALAAALPLVRLAATTMARLIPRDQSDVLSRSSLIGRVAVVIRGVARRGAPAEAKVRDRATGTHYILVEPDLETELFRAGDEVLIVRESGAGFRAIHNNHPALSSGESPS